MAFGLDDFSIGLWDVINDTQVQTLADRHGGISSVAFSPNGETIVSASLGSQIGLWDPKSEQCLHILEGDSDLIYATVFSPDGEILATAGEDGTIRIWQVTSGECLRVISLPKPYEGTNIAGVKGLSNARIDSLKILGAVEN